MNTKKNRKNYFLHLPTQKSKEKSFPLMFFLFIVKSLNCLYILISTEEVDFGRVGWGGGEREVTFT